MAKIVMIRSQPVNPDVRIEKEAEALVKNGHNVTILAWDRDGSCSQMETKSGYTIKRMELSVPPGSIKVAFYLPIWWFFIFFHLINKNWDIVHAADFDTFIPALIAAKIKRKVIIYDIFDFYADMIGFPILPKVSRKTIGRIDKFLMKFANVVIIADESRVKQIGKNANKHVVTITNSPKEDILNNIDSINGQERNKFVIFFGGVIDEDRNIDKMILAVKDLDDVRLIIIGYSTQRYGEKLKEVSKSAKNIEMFLKRAPYEEIIKRTVNADLLFALYDPVVPNNRYASPNKLFEAMMCGMPILVSDGTSMADIVRKHNCGIVVRCESVEEIQSIVTKLKNDPQLCKELGKNGRRAYEGGYNWKIMEKRLINLYDELPDHK